MTVENRGSINNTDREEYFYQNPILHADYSDPDVIRDGDDFYMVASSFTYLPGVPLLHSKDLVHWELINYCVERLPFSRYDQPAHGCGCWAPSIRKHGEMFYVFIPLPDEGIFIATAKDPYGKWSLHCLKESYGWIPVHFGMRMEKRIWYLHMQKVAVESNIGLAFVKYHLM